MTVALVPVIDLELNNYCTFMSSRAHIHFRSQQDARDMLLYTARFLDREIAERHSMEGSLLRTVEM